MRDETRQHKYWALCIGVIVTEYAAEHGIKWDDPAWLLSASYG